MIAGWIGDALWAELVDRRPLLLMALNPRNRYLALVSNEIDSLRFYLVGTIRLTVADPVNFLLGLWFGERALAWVTRRSRTYGPLVDEGAVYFRRFALPLIFIMPNNIICALAGATGVKVRAFVIANVTGTIARLFLIRQFSSYFAEPIGGVTGFVGRYRTPILIISVLAVAWTIFGEFRGNNSEVRTLVSLDDDLNGDDPPDEPREHQADSP